MLQKKKVGKDENADYQHFLLFTYFFQKLCPLGTLKLEILSESYEIQCLKRFSNKPCFLQVSRTCLLKTLWEKEKLLVTSNFSFSHRVFYPFGELSAIFTNFKLSSAYSFNLEESKICRLWERIKMLILHCYSHYGLTFVTQCNEEATYTQF